MDKRKRMIKYLLILLLFLISCKNDSVKIVRITDGDTFWTSKGEEIRLAEVDAPEIAHKNSPAQPYGYEAKVLAERVLLNKEVGIIRQGKDSYGRTIAKVYTISDGVSFAQILIDNGLAHITPWTKDKGLIRDYWEIRNKGIGLFQEEFEYPYVHRRRYHLK